MIVGADKDQKAQQVQAPDARSAAMKVLISPQEGWQDHVMRVIELEQGGFTPRHTHPWPHINYILEGQGILHIDGQDHEVTAGSYAFVPAGSPHQYQNASKSMFRFICIVPKEGHIT